MELLFLFALALLTDDKKEMYTAALIRFEGDDPR
jgi:hypothetical protein